MINDLDNWDKLRLRLLYNLFHVMILISKFCILIFFYFNMTNINCKLILLLDSVPFLNLSIKSLRQKFYVDFIRTINSKPCLIWNRIQLDSFRTFLNTCHLQQFDKTFIHVQHLRSSFAFTMPSIDVVHGHFTIVDF